MKFNKGDIVVTEGMSMTVYQSSKTKTRCRFYDAEGGVHLRTFKTAKIHLYDTYNRRTFLKRPRVINAPFVGL